MPFYINLGRKSKLPVQLKRGHDFRKTDGNIKSGNKESSKKRQGLRNSYSKRSSAAQE